MFKREGVTLSQSTINGWFNATSKLLEPLYETLVKQVKQQDYLQVDESPIRVQDNHKPGTTHIGYHWVYYAPKTRQAVFDYQSSRSREGPANFLETFKGTLQTDGYSAYNEFGETDGITLIGCMAHARRYFEKAQDNDKKRSEHALKVIQELYAIEREARDKKLDGPAIRQLRQEQSLPILLQWKDWLQDQQLTP